MTVTIASGAPASSSLLTVTGTRHRRVRTATPVALNVSATVVGAGPIGIKFAGTSPIPMDASETAGVVPISNWNTATGATSALPQSLVDASGAQTGVTVTWSANNIWTMPIADQPGNLRMMKGYLDSSSTSTTTVTVTRLVRRAYDVYVYADGDNRTYDRPGLYTISSGGIAGTTIRSIDAASTNFSGVFKEASNSKGNYVKFSITGSDVTVTATPAPGSGTQRAPVNAIEIVPSASVVRRHQRVLRRHQRDRDGRHRRRPASFRRRTGITPRAQYATAPLPLIDEAGTNTNATLVWNANNTWATPIADQLGNRRMMKGYLDTSNTSVTTISVTGLDNRDYDIYVYADGDNRTFTRSAAYTVSGPGIVTTTATLIDQANTNFAGGLIPANNSAGNYIRLSVTGTAFTLTAMPLTGGNSTLRAPVNGIQIVPKGS